MPSLRQKFLWKALNLWPPYLGAGISVREIAGNRRHLRVTMKLKWFNKNYVGTQFGGSLYSMTDPFFMLILMNELGGGYVVWDKAGRIEFKKPGRGTVTADFVLSAEQIDEIRRKADSQSKHVFELPVTILDAAGETVAEVLKTLYVRRKELSPSQA